MSAIELPSTLPLTPREMQILQKMADGYTTNQQIAEQLYLSTRTIKNHMANIYVALGVENRCAAILVALRDGLIINRYENRDE